MTLSIFTRAASSSVICKWSNSVITNKMLTEVTNFFTQQWVGGKKWHHLFFKDPLTLLVGIHFCAVLRSFKKTTEPTTFLKRQKALLGVSSSNQPCSFWGAQMVCSGPWGTTGPPQLDPGRPCVCWELAFSGVHDWSFQMDKWRVTSQPRAAARMTMVFLCFQTLPSHFSDHNVKSSHLPGTQGLSQSASQAGH